MKKSSLLLFLPSLLLAYMDLGHIGTEYEIEEEDLIEKIEKGKAGINRETLSHEVIKAAEDALRSDAPFGMCTRESDTNGVFTVESVGAYRMSGEPYIKKGDRFTPKYVMDVTACAVDGSNQKILDASMEGFKQRGIVCDRLMVSGKRIDEVLLPAGSYGKLYPYSKLAGGSLEFTCLPYAAKITKNGIRRVYFPVKPLEGNNK